MAIKGVMLDFHGVLVEAGDHSAAVCHELGVDRKEYDIKRKECSAGKFHYRKLLRWLSDKSGKSKGQVADVMRRNYALLYKPRAGLKELAKVRQKKIVLTNAIKGALEPVFRQLGLYEDFDDVIISSEVGARKPDARMYRKALKALGTRPEETLYVGDEQVDLDAAKELGIHTAFMQGLDEKAKADYSFSSLAELARFLNSGRAKQ